MKKKVGLSNACWVKSDLSDGGDNCLEVACVDGVVVLIISEADYRAFVGGIGKGQRSLLLP